MLQRFGLWPVVLVLVLAFGLSAWTANEKTKPPPVVAICDPAPKFVSDEGKPGAPVAAGAVSPDDAFKKYLPWKPGPEVQKTASGLQYVILAHGDPKGAHPKPTDHVAVLYDGRLAANGKKFDSTTGDETATFGVGQVIPGWTEGLQLMVPGDEAIFYIPANIAYGERSPDPVIPANSDLVFVVTLKKIVAAREPYEACWKKVIPWKDEAGHKLAKGIQYFSVGDGPKSEPTVGATDIVSAYIEARLEDGSSLGGNFSSGRPLMAPVTGIAPGLDMVMQKMRPGDHWFVKLPNEVAFPPTPGGPPPPKGPIILEVLLDQVMRMPAQAAEPGQGAPPPGASAPPAEPPMQSTAPPAGAPK